MDIFEIKLHDDKVVYHDGDTVNGELNLRFKETMDVKRIELKFCGKAFAGWSERRGDETFRQKQKLFKEVKTVYGEDKGHSSSTSTGSLRGDLNFPFSFRLPSLLPSSYKDGAASIKYLVKGTIVRTISNLKTKQRINVVRTVDLNKIRKIMGPSFNNEEINVCCFCCKSGTIEGDIRLDRSGYAPGDTITVNATIKNMSSSRVRATSVKLVQSITYKAQGNSQTGKHTKVKYDGPQCRSGETTKLNDVKLVVPPLLLPTDTRGCLVMEITYAVTLHGRMGWFASDLRADASVIIGNVPMERQPGAEGNRDQLETHDFLWRSRTDTIL